MFAAAAFGSGSVGCARARGPVRAPPSVFILDRREIEAAAIKRVRCFPRRARSLGRTALRVWRRRQTHKCPAVSRSVNTLDAAGITYLAAERLRRPCVRPFVRPVVRLCISVARSRTFKVRKPADLLSGSSAAPRRCQCEVRSSDTTLEMPGPVVYPPALIIAFPPSLFFFLLSLFAFRSPNGSPPPRRPIPQ